MRRAHSYCYLLPVAALLLVTPLRAEAAERVFYVYTLHLDGITSTQETPDHPPEAFPTQPLPPGEGLTRRAPDAAGAWRVRAFVFEPAQIVVEQGDTVVLHFVGIQGPRHAIRVDGVDGELALKRGEIQTARFTADSPGVRRYRCTQHEPTMSGEVVVLPHTPIGR